MDQDTRFLSTAASALAVAAADLAADNDEAEFQRFNHFMVHGRPASYYQNELWEMWGGREHYLELLARRDRELAAQVSPTAVSDGMEADQRRHAKQHGTGCAPAWD